MALTATRNNLRRTAELDIKVKWIIVSMKIDRISRTGNISDAKLFPNKVVFLSVRHYVTFQWRPQLLGEKYFWHVTTSIMYKQVHNVSPRASVSCTPAGVYLYKPPASQKEILVRLKVMFVLSWSRLEGIIYCVLAGGECELQFLGAEVDASWVVPDASTLLLSIPRMLNL